MMIKSIRAIIVIFIMALFEWPWGEAIKTDDVVLQ